MFYDFQPSSLQETIFLSKYAYPGEDKWKDCADRVAKAISLAEPIEEQEKWHQKFYQSIATADFIPGGRILFGAGRLNYNMLNCYVLDPEDNVESIGKTLSDMYKISCAGGGVGFNFSKIRPKGNDIQNIKFSAPGAISVMHTINEIGTHVRAGKNRRTALMAILSVSHPDFLEFLEIKLNRSQLTNFNISVAITNRFIEAIENNEDWYFTYGGRHERYDIYSVERTSKEGNDVVYVVAKNPEHALGIAPIHFLKHHEDTFTNANITILKARDLWDKIVKNAMECGEPGIFNIDFSNSYTNVSYFENMPATNPCGEEVLPAYGNCCLGHINLANMVEDTGEIDWKKLAKTIRIGVRFLDNILTTNTFPIPECREVGFRSRRIGLGVTGFHYFLIKAGYKYGDERCLEFTERLFSTIRDEAYKASMYLAREKGSFKAYDFSQLKKEGFFKTLPNRIRADIKRYGLRNAVILTVAPTGCQHPDSLIISDSGIFELGEIVDQKGKQWQNYGVEADLIGKVYPKVIDDINVMRNVTKGFVNGVAPIKDIKLNSGIRLRATLNHKYRVFDFEKDTYEWKETKDLMVGDYVVSQIGGYNRIINYKLNAINFDNFPKEITSDFAYFLGLYYADGSNHKRSIRIHCNADDSEQINKAIILAKDLFNIDAKVNKDTRENCVSVNLNSVELLEYFKINNLLKNKAHEVNIPIQIRSSSTNSLESFINGYHMGDGCVTKNGNWYIDTVSEKMAQQLLVCLRALGYNCKMYIDIERKSTKGSRPSYRIRKVGYGSSDFDQYRYVSVDIKEKLAKVKEINNNLIFDEVISIQDGIEMTLDIEVPDGNTYIANSIVSHNTISMVAGVSTGIEPIFAPVYKRRWRSGTEGVWNETIVIDPLFRTMYLRGKNLDHIVGAYDVTPEEHIKMQSAIQSYIDSAISKTCNLPETFQFTNETSDFLLQYVSEIKGFTFYKAGSRGNEPLSVIDWKTIDLDKLIVEGRMEEISSSVESCKTGVCEL